MGSVSCKENCTEEQCQKLAGRSKGSIQKLVDCAENSHLSVDSKNYNEYPLCCKISTGMFDNCHHDVKYKIGNVTYQYKNSASDNDLFKKHCLYSQPSEMKSDAKSYIEEGTMYPQSIGDALSKSKTLKKFTTLDGINKAATDSGHFVDSKSAEAGIYEQSGVRNTGVPLLAAPFMTRKRWNDVLNVYGTGHKKLLMDNEQKTIILDELIGKKSFNMIYIAIGVGVVVLLIFVMALVSKPNKCAKACKKLSYLSDEELYDRLESKGCVQTGKGSGCNAWTFDEQFVPPRLSPPANKKLRPTNVMQERREVPLRQPRQLLQQPKFDDGRYDPRLDSRELPMMPQEGYYNPQQN